MGPPRQHLVKQGAPARRHRCRGQPSIRCEETCSGRHVRRSTQEHSVERDPLVIHQKFRQAEVGYLGRSVLCDQDVARVQVAMDDPSWWATWIARARVSVSRADQRKACGFPRSIRVDSLPVRTPSPEREGPRVRRSRRSERRWDGATGRPPRPRSVVAPAPAARVLAGQDHLECDDPAQAGLAGLVHDPHTPPADLLEDLVAADP